MTTNHGHFTILALALTVNLLPSAIAQSTLKTTPIISVNPSNIVRELSERARQAPALTPAELAAYGNDLIGRKGFDFDFDVCNILSESDRANSSQAGFVRTYQLNSIDGGKLTVRFTIRDLDDSLCGECWTSIPSLQVTDKEMTLIAEGKRYRVRRPASFYLDEAQLVDETLKKVKRTWQLPYQAMPAGISADGTKLYVDFYSGSGLDDLVLELSKNGTPQFRDRAVIKSTEGKFIENHPTDPNNAYLSFMSFRVGEKTYRLKFSAPCT